MHLHHGNYDEATDTYTVTTSDNVYTIRIVKGKAVITFEDKPKEEEEKPIQ